MCVHLNELNATDSWTDDKREEHIRLELVHRQRERELGVVRHEREQYERLAPVVSGRGVEAERRKAFKGWLAKGMDGLSADEVQEFLQDPPEGIAGYGKGFVLRGGKEMATRSDNVSGQEALQETTYPGLVNRLNHFGGIQKMARIFNTATASDFNYPQLDSTAQMGRRLGNQDAAVNNTDINNIGVITFKGHTYTSDKIGVTMEMIQDSTFDIESEIEMRATNRLGRVESEDFTNGSGTNAPFGVVTQASAGVTTASKTTLTWEDLVDLQYGVPRAYRVGGEMGPGGLSNMVIGDGAATGYLLSDSAEQTIRKLEDSDGRPLWLPSIREGMPSTILGYPYNVSGELAGFGASAATGDVVGLFGDFGYFCIRRVMNVAVYRFWDSSTATNNRVEVLAFSRADSRMAGALVAGACEAVAKLDLP